MRFVIIFFSLIVLTKIVAQKAKVQLICEQTQAEVDERISFTVKTNVSGDIKIDYPKNFLRSYGNMSGMQQEVNYSTGEVSTIYFLSQEGVFKTNGTFTIYAYVETAKKIYKSNAIKITIGSQEKDNVKIDDEISLRIIKQPIFGVIKRSKDKVYEGEALYLEAKVYTKLHINMMSDYRPYEYSADANSKEIGKSSQLTLKKEILKGQEFLSFTHDKRIVFPQEIGKVKLKPFEMAIQYENGSIFSDEMTFVSNAAMIEVIPLPKNSPKEFIGLVGKLSVNSSINSENLALGDVFELTLNLEGEGNMHQIRKPKIVLPKGLQFYADPEIKEDISFGVNGASGSVTYTYFVKTSELGDIKLPSIRIAYFNPKSEKYEIASSKSINIKVDNNKIASSNNNLNIKDDQNGIIQSVTSAETKLNNKNYDSIFWLSLLSPFLLVIVGGIFFVKKKNNSKIINKNINSFAEIEMEKYNCDFLKRELLNIKKIEELEYKIFYKQLNDWILRFSLVFNKNKVSSLQGLINLLNEKKLPEDFVKEIEKFYLKNEEQQYSYYLNQNNFNESTVSAENILNEFENQIRIINNI